MLLDKLESITNSGIDLVRLDFTNESNHIARLQSVYYDYLNNNIDINETKNFVEQFKEENNITNGHYFRGILSDGKQF
jgi:putative protease